MKSGEFNAIIDAPLFEVLADLLTYPDRSFERYAETAVSAAGNLPEALNALEKFRSECMGLTDGRRQELYTRTFEIDPLCIPYIGVLLFGEESFKRGELMARFRGAMLEHGVDSGSDLPDHLAPLLRLLPRLPGEDAAELVEYCLRGPLNDMADRLAATENPYRHLLAAVLLLLREQPDFPTPSVTASEEAAS